MRYLRGIIGIFLIAGCSGRTSSLLLERHALGPLTQIGAVGRPIDWQLEPVMQTQSQGQVEVTVTFASHDYLKTFFDDRQVFGKYAGLIPYFPENLVFYVKVVNHSAKRVRINPADFVLIDDCGNQYALLNADYVTALEEHRQPFASTTRELLEDARPGYFGLSVPVGKWFAAKPQHRFALMKQSSLQAGSLYPGVVHDGLIAFWSPSKDATTFRLLITNLKTEFNAGEIAQTAFEFPFAFKVVAQR